MNVSTENNQPPLLLLDREVFIERVKAFNEEEWQIVMKLAGTRRIKAEYFRRTDKVWDLVNDLSTALSQISTHAQTEDVEDVVKDIRELLKIKE